MISAKLANKAYVKGGVFDKGDYLSRIWWLGGEIKSMTLVGQTSMNVQMSAISKPTYDKVLAKVKKKGYKIQDEHYSYILSEGKFTISWGDEE